MKISVAMLAAILDLTHLCDDDHKLRYMIGFFDLKNIYFDIRITFLSVILKEIWPFEISGGHIGGHLEYLKMLQGDNRPL